jgi:diguanylate cyclase (GGDEF)-like protein
MTSHPVLIFLKTRWGLERFFIILLAAAAIVAMVTQNPAFYASFMRGSKVPWVMLFFYLLMYGTCFASFSRIYKFKVFFLGHLFLATGLIYLYLNNFAFARPDAFYNFEFLKKVGRLDAQHILLGFMSFNLLVVTASPPTLKYRMTRLLAMLILIFELFLFFLVLYNIGRTPKASLLIYGNGFLLAVYMLNLAAILLSVLLVKEEYSFGGVISALAFINILLAHNVDSASSLLSQVFFLLEPLLITAGVLFFWFSCLQHRVAYDPLLKIYNREYAVNILSGMSHVSLGKAYCVAMIDIDRFKSVNDNFGHPAGDNVLYGTAQCVKKNAMPHGITCRYGGEEIIVFFRNMKEEDTYNICELIRRSVKKITYSVSGKELSVSVSIGVAECDDLGVPIERVVKAADDALYKAKETGRNKVLVGRIRKRVSNPNRLTTMLVRATGTDRRRSESGRG